MISRLNSTVTPSAADLRPGVQWEDVLLGVVMSGLVVMTVVGNVLVVVVVARNKSLQTVFNAFIVNLAVTDIVVAVIAMSFFGISETLGRWPFGVVMCGVWMFFDFGMTFCSIFTLVAISVDRYWSVHWSHHYRLHNNWRKAAIFIAAVWCSMLVVWVPAFVVDRLNNSREGKCFFDPEKNKAFVIFVVIFAYHGTTIIIVYCYAKVYQFIRQLCKTSALVGPGSVFARKDNNFIAGTSTPTMLFSATPHPHTNITSVSRTEKDRKDDTHVDDDNEMTSLTTAVKSVEDVVHSSAYSSECLLPAPICASQDTASSTAETDKDETSLRALSPTTTGRKIARLAVTANDGNLTTATLDVAADCRGTLTTNKVGTAVDATQNFDGSSTGTDVENRSLCRKFKKEIEETTVGRSVDSQKRFALAVRRERRTFVTVSCFMLGYLICWLPYHVVFSIMAIDSRLVPKWLYNVTYWLTYCNSTINPFLYSFGSPQFYKAFRNIVSCRKASRHQ